VKVDQKGRVYYVDHANCTTQWEWPQPTATDNTAGQAALKQVGPFSTAEGADTAPVPRASAEAPGKPATADVAVNNSDDLLIDARRASLASSEACEGVPSQRGLGSKDDAVERAANAVTELLSGPEMLQAVQTTIATELSRVAERCTEPCLAQEESRGQLLLKIVVPNGSGKLVEIDYPVKVAEIVQQARAGKTLVIDLTDRVPEDFYEDLADIVFTSESEREVQKTPVPSSGDDAVDDPAWVDDVDTMLDHPTLNGGTVESEPSVTPVCSDSVWEQVETPTEDAEVAHAAHIEEVQSASNEEEGRSNTHDEEVRPELVASPPASDDNFLMVETNSACSDFVVVREGDVAPLRAKQLARKIFEKLKQSELDKNKAEKRAKRAARRKNACAAESASKRGDAKAALKAKKEREAKLLAKLKAMSGCKEMNGTSDGTAGDLGFDDYYSEGPIM